jgi:hypothetical protein
VGCINVYLPESKATPTPTQTPTPTPTLPAANLSPVAFIDGISPSVVTQGMPVTFTGNGKDQDGSIIAYEWRSNLDGVLSSAQSFTTNTLSVGVHTIYFRVQDNSAQWSEPVTGSITVNPRVALPTVLLFSANPQNIGVGSTVTLSWNVNGSTQISIDNGIGIVSQVGSRNVYPVTSTVYTLTATNQAGSTTATVMVSVMPSQVIGDPIINYFQAQYLGGTSWQLRWSVSNASSITIDPEIGMVASSGTTIVNAPAPKTYELTATNSWGWSRYFVVIGYQSFP